ncbi:MAG: peptide chain release factor N(5)-glutamine methyltransferase, partial [Flavobacteriaceae bacterium]
MTLKEIRSEYHIQLDDIYDFNEVESFFYMLIEQYFQLPKYSIALEPDKVISGPDQTIMLEALEELKSQKPIQYILGNTEFFGLHFKLNKDVLIPRLETEELVTWVLEECQGMNLKILDVGTGSGCIAIVLAKNLPEAQISGLDISRRAIGLATENASINDVGVRFFQTDILLSETLSEEIMDKEFDIIVSNPPYVLNSEKKEMRLNVLDNEPHSALFVDDDRALLFYNGIIEFAKKALKVNGRLYFEINEKFGQEICNLLKTNKYSDIQLKQDIY